MIENLQDEPYQSENKQAKGAKIRVNIKRETQKMPLLNFLTKF